MVQTTRRPKWLLAIMKTASVVASLTVIFNMSALGVFLAPQVANAATSLTTQVVSWNILGLDSNDPATAGPHDFLIQVRVANTGVTTATGVQTAFSWGSGSANAYLSLLSSPAFPLNSINAGSYKDAFYVVRITPPASPDSPSNAAFDTSRPFTVTTTSPDASSTSASQTLYIEHILSQSRNHILSSTVTPPNPLVGEPFVVHVEYETASLYNHITPQMTFNPSVATLDSVETEYVTDGATESDIYAVNHGNVVHSDFHFRANSAGNLNFFYTVLDNSGSSYHYNADFSNAIIVPVDPRQNLEKSVDKDTAQPGDAITYTLNYFNTGNIDLQNVVITETYDARFIYGSAVPAPTSGNNVWNIGTLPVATGGSITINGTLTGSFPSGTTKVHNKAKMSTTTPNVADLYATADTFVTTACELTITKLVDKENAKPGDTLTYTLNFENTGTASCTGGGVRVDDARPTGTTYTGTHTQTSNVSYGYAYNKFGVISDGYDEATGLLSWNAHELTPGESGTVTYQVTINPIDFCTETDIPNTAKIYSNEIPSGITSNEVSTHVAADCLGKLKVKKFVDVGEMTPDNWSFTVGNTTLTPAQGTNYVVFDLPAGTYSATESTVPGYHQVSTTCDNVNVVPNQEAVCEFHNAQDRGNLTVIKHVVGSNEPASSWTMNVAGNTPLSFAGSEAGITNEVVAGNYSVTETGPSGYTLTYSGDCDAQGNVTIAHGDNKTCTLTNTRDTGRIIVYKNVDTDGDGDIDVTGATDWTWDIASGAQNIATGTGTGVDTGAYTISEDQKANFHVTNLTCDNQSYGAVESAQINVVKDQVVTCTFTNARDTGDLRIKKYEDLNGDGNIDVGEPYITGWDFTVSQNAQTVATGTTNANDNNWLLIYDIPTGTYDVTETLQANWINTEPGTTPATKQVTITKDQLTSVWFGNFELGKIFGYKWNDVDQSGNWTDGDVVLEGWTICLDLDVDVCTQTNANGYYEFTGLSAGTYTVYETVLPGWTAVFPTTSHEITIQSGDEKQADFFNFKYGKISGYKWNDLNGDGSWDNGEPALENWTISLWKDGQVPAFATDTTDANGYYEFTGLLKGSYIVTEDESNTAWTRTYPANPGAHGPFSVVSGSNFPNNNFGNFNIPTLTVIKHVINDNGGNAVASDFTMNVTGTNVSDDSFPGDENGTTVTLWAGAYSVDELEIDGYEKTVGANCSGSVQSGDEVTCTITNNDEAPTITLSKEVINNNGGNAQPNDFNLTIGGASALSGVTYQVDANTPYALDETQLSGYTFVSLTGDEKCPLVLGGTVTLDEGEDVSCTITNDDDASSITLIKNVINNNGGNASANDFGLTIGATPVTSGQTLSVLANTPYALNEAGLTGYAFVSLTGEGCPAELGGEVTLDEGENITCTITNDDEAPSITLIKNVVNNNGGNALPDDFNLTIGANPAISGVKYDVNANTAYALNETQLSGYDFVEITGDEKCPAVLGGEVTLDEGEDITCTITNDDQAPSITLIKSVTNNNGGQAGANDFGLTIGGTPVTSGQTLVVNANTAYALNEAGLTGYAFVSLTGNAKCPAVLGGEVTLDEGEDITCTITNDDIAPKLKLVKTVTNDDGGTLEVADFPLFIDQTLVTSGQWNTVLANVQYTASETNQYGYSASSWGGDCAANGTITLQPGDQKICTITNDDIEPRLTVTKIVTNDNGGTAEVVDFPLFVNATSVTSGVENGFDAGNYVVSETNLSGYSAVITGDCDANGNVTLGVGDVKSCTITNNDITAHLTLEKFVTTDDGGDAVPANWTLSATGTATPLSGNGYVEGDVNAGIYTLSESGPDGYDASDWVCDGGTLNGNELTLDLNESAYCSITNDDITAHLTLEKFVTNDDGGDNVATDWELTAQGPVTLSDYGYADGDVWAGTYTLSESGPDGYTASDWQCEGGDLDGNELSLVLGESAYCWITNNDEAPSITLIKSVSNDNGGDADANDFGLTIGDTSVTSGQTLEVDANTPYALDEAGLFGYSFVSLTGEGCPTELGGTVTLDEGEDITCTITNDDIEPRLTVTKIVTNDNGGTAEVADFPLFVNATSVTSGVENGFDAGNYVVSETNLSGYSAVITGDCDANGNVTLGVGDVKSCTITNDDIPGKISGFKYSQQGEILVGLEGWEICLDAGTENERCTTTLEDGYYEFNNVPAGLHDVAETLQYGWQTVDPVSGEYDDVVVNLNETTEVDFVNKLNEFDVSIDKVADETVQAGAEMTYTLYWEVTGNTPVYNATIKDALPANTTFVLASDGGTENGGTVTWYLNSPLNPGDSGFVTLTVLVKTPLADGTEIDNDAQICGAGEILDEEGYFSSIDGQTQEFPVKCDDDNTTTEVESDFTVDIEKTGPETAEAGSAIVYTLDWQVTGNAPIDELVITDVVPTNTTFVSANNGGTESLGTVTWNLGAHVPGDSGQVTMTVAIVSPLDNETLIDNTGEICGVSYTRTQEEIIEHCDDDTTTTTVESAPILGVVKSNDKEDTTVSPTETINYTILWSVDGNSKATNVTLVDTIPSEITVNVASISDGGVWDGATRTITWDLGTQIPHAEGFVTYSATVNSPAADGTVIHNVAKLSSEETDPEFVEDDSDTTIVSNPVLGIEKTVDIGNDLGFVNPGATVEYTVVVTNTGTDTAYNVQLSDTLPDGFLFADTLTPTNTFDLGDIAVGGSVTTTYDVIVGKNVLTGFYDNLAVATADNHDPVDDSATVEVRVPTPQGEETEPILSIVKTVNVTFANPGDTIEYTVVVTNSGDGQALDVTLTDTLPTGFTFEDGTQTKTWNLGAIAVGASQTVVYKVKVGSTVKAGDYENLAIARASNHDPVQDSVSVEVRVPAVLADTVPKTGVALRDFIIFFASMLLIVAGAIFIRQGNRVAVQEEKE